MKLYLINLYLNSITWPLPLLLQLSVISQTPMFTCWQQFYRFWVVSFTKTELSFSLTKFSCTRCLSVLPVICLRGFHRSAANAFQELQLLASSDKCPTAAQKKGKVIFRNEKHSSAFIFFNVAVTVHNHNVKLRQTNHSYRKPIQFLLTNFHIQMVLRVITEHVHFNLNPTTFAERAIEPSAGAWPVQVSIWVFAKTTNLSSHHTSSPWGNTCTWCQVMQGKGSSPPSHSWNEVLPGRSTQNSSALLMGHLPKIHVTKWRACQGGWSAMI